MITASRALFIRLGEGNSWARRCFETDSLRLGFSEITHDMALDGVSAGDFSVVRDYYMSAGVSRSTATRYSNEVREFYTAGPDVLWITFAEGRLWWCFASAEVRDTQYEDQIEVGVRNRQAINGWSDKSVHGETLWINQLRGSLTTTAGFRGTICRVREFEYLLRRLNGMETDATKDVRAARDALIASVIPLIKGLHWKDFELLSELVMTQGGWQRISATGETQETIDLELEQPLTRERAVVQVKSRLSNAVASEVAEKLLAVAGGARIFLVYHTATEPNLKNPEGIEFIGPDELARHVIDLGLVQWLMAKVG